MRERVKHSISVCLFLILCGVLTVIVWNRFGAEEVIYREEEPVATVQPTAQAQESPSEVVERVVEQTTPPTPEIVQSDAVCLAKMVYGEARGLSMTEQAACVWCVLNRVDAGYGTLQTVVTAPYQFVGYQADNPVTDEILALCEDVLYRYAIESHCAGSVGRVLPKEYLYFTGDGEHNHFRTEYTGGCTWDWSLESPYE